MMFQILGMVLVASASALAQPAEVILFRHAEKPLDDSIPHLSLRGRERAAALAWYLDGSPLYTNYGRPVVIFAAAPTVDSPSERPVETVTPYADRMGLSVDTTYNAAQFAALGSFIQTNADFAGKTVVICWPHEEIPALAHALGVRSAPNWKAGDFSHVWVIRYTLGKVRLLRIAERLMFGDPSH